MQNSWGGDHDLEDDEEYSIVTDLSCPNCMVKVQVRINRKNIYGKVVSNDLKEKKILSKLFGGKEKFILIKE